MSSLPKSGRRKSLAIGASNEQKASSSLTGKARRRTIAGANLDKENGANTTASTRESSPRTSKAKFSPVAKSPGEHNSAAKRSPASKPHKSPFRHTSKTRLPDTALHSFFKIRKTPSKNASFETTSPNGSFLNESSFLSMASSSSTSSGSDSDPLNVSAMSDTTGFSSAQFVAQLSSRQKSKAFRKEGRRSAQFAKQPSQQLFDRLSMPNEEQKAPHQPQASFPMSNSRPPLNTMKSTISHEVAVSVTTTRRTSGEYDADKTKEFISKLRQQNEKRRPRLSSASTASNASELSIMHAELRGLASPVVEGNQITKRRKSEIGHENTSVSLSRRETANTSDLALLRGNDDSTVDTSDFANLNFSRESVTDSDFLRSSKGGETTRLSIPANSKRDSLAHDPMDETVDASAFDLFSEGETEVKNDQPVTGEAKLVEKILPTYEKQDAPEPDKSQNQKEAPSPPIATADNSAVEGLEGDSGFDLRSPLDMKQDRNSGSKGIEKEVGSKSEMDKDAESTNMSDLDLWSSPESHGRKKQSRRSTMSLSLSEARRQAPESSLEKAEDCSVMDKSLADAQAAARALFESGDGGDMESNGDSPGRRLSSLNLSQSSRGLETSPHKATNSPKSSIDNSLVDSPARNTRLQARLSGSKSGKSPIASSVVDSPARNTRLQARLSRSGEKAPSVNAVDSPARNTRLKARLSRSGKKAPSGDVIDSSARNTRLQARLVDEIHFDEKTSSVEEKQDSPTKSPPSTRGRRSSLNRTSKTQESRDIIVPVHGMDPNSSFSSLQLKSSIRKSNRPRLSGSARVAFGSPQTLHFNKNSPPMSATPNPSTRKAKLRSIERDSVEIRETRQGQLFEGIPDNEDTIEFVDSPTMNIRGPMDDAVGEDSDSEMEDSPTMSIRGTAGGSTLDDNYNAPTNDLADGSSKESPQESPEDDDSNMVESPTMSLRGNADGSTMELEDNLAIVIAQQGDFSQGHAIENRNTSLTQMDRKEATSQEMEETRDLEARLSNVLGEDDSVDEFGKGTFEASDAVAKRTWSQTFLQNNDETTVQLEGNLAEILDMQTSDGSELLSSAKRRKQSESVQLTHAEIVRDGTDTFDDQEQNLTLTVNDILPLLCHPSKSSGGTDPLLSLCQLVGRSSCCTVQDSIHGFLEHVISHLESSGSFSEVGSDYFDNADDSQKSQLLRLKGKLNENADDVKDAMRSATLSVTRKQESVFTRWLGSSAEQLVGATHTIATSMREREETTKALNDLADSRLRKLEEMRNSIDRMKLLRKQKRILLKMSQIEDAMGILRKRKSEISNAKRFALAKARQSELSSRLKEIYSKAESAEAKWHICTKVVANTETGD